MKKSLATIFLILIIYNSLSGQTNEKFYCQLFEMFYQPEIPIYENSTSKTIKLVYEDMNIVDNYHLSMEGEKSYSYDTITTLNPINKIINNSDKLITANSFTPIDLINTEEFDANKILFEQRIDFIGDSKLDKLEITYARKESNNKTPFLIKLYENQNGKLVHCINCDSILRGNPLSYYVSQIEHLDMKVIFVLFEKENKNLQDEKLLKLELIYAHRFEN